ncbi:MAG: hypothetical protein HQM10_00090 [Candidatus Riflebacteria bacterium]|nr:hypothetical protein [Candidatus Riflebacteria bacterium]
MKSLSRITKVVLLTVLVSLVSITLEAGIAKERFNKKVTVVRNPVSLEKNEKGKAAIISLRNFCREKQIYACIHEQISSSSVKTNEKGIILRTWVEAENDAKEYGCNEQLIALGQAQSKLFDQLINGYSTAVEEKAVI